jgi:hypothetical protein
VSLFNRLINLIDCRNESELTGVARYAELSEKLRFR